jgi:hypothetical protein
LGTGNFSSAGSFSDKPLFLDKSRSDPIGFDDGTKSPAIDIVRF